MTTDLIGLVALVKSSHGCLGVRAICRGLTGVPSLGVGALCSRVGKALLDSLHYLLSIVMVLPWHRLMARATEVAKEIGIGVGGDGYAERNANAGEQSHDEP